MFISKGSMSLNGGVPFPLNPGCLVPKGIIKMSGLLKFNVLFVSYGDSSLY